MMLSRRNVLQWLGILPVGYATIRMPPEPPIPLVQETIAADGKNRLLPQEEIVREALRILDREILASEREDASP